MQVCLLAEEQQLSPRTVAGLLHPARETLSVELVAALVEKIHVERGPGAVLVFLPGWDEISLLAGLLSSRHLLHQASVKLIQG